MLRVVRGQADEDEIAALLTALVVAAAQPAVVPPPRRAPLSEWARPVPDAAYGSLPNGWRRSGLPTAQRW